MHVIRSEIVKGRHQYQCTLCGGTIDKGETHHVFTVRDGGIHTSRCHQECNNLANKLEMEDEEGIVYADAFDECISEEYKRLNLPEPAPDTIWGKVSAIASAPECPLRGPSLAEIVMPVISVEGNNT